MVAAAFVIAGSLVQVFIAAFLTPRFATIFEDMGRGRPLPSLTVIVIEGRWVLVGLSCIWALAAVFIVPQKAPRPWLLAMLAALFFSIAFSLVGLFLGLENLH